MKPEPLMASVCAAAPAAAEAGARLLMAGMRLALAVAGLEPPPPPQPPTISSRPLTVMACQYRGRRSDLGTVNITALPLADGLDQKLLCGLSAPAGSVTQVGRG